MSASPSGLSRRTVLQTMASASLAGGLAPLAAAHLSAAPQAVGGSDSAPPAAPSTAKPEVASAPVGRHVAVLGAGVFGVFTALALRRKGNRVTLLDPWGPGNARASSGGETRVIRGVYGGESRYTAMAQRAFALWRENEARWGRRLLHPTGALWMAAGGDDSFIRDSMPVLRAHGLPFEELRPETLRKRWPQISFEGVQWALHEEGAGYLLARQACAVARDGFVAEGGEYRQVAAQPGSIAAGALSSLRLADGESLQADAYVFACGPWLPAIFPEVLGAVIRATRQEVFYFGTPRDDQRFEAPGMPIWAELGERFFYGIPGNERRGFKVADDTRGEPFDPTSGERAPSSTALANARALLARRFPALAAAPLLEARVCQYENSPDSRFILDRHPDAANAWLVGGGSGHGFKFGPAWGEDVAATVRGERPVDPFFALARLRGVPPT